MAKIKAIFAAVILATISLFIVPQAVYADGPVTGGDTITAGGVYDVTTGSTGLITVSTTDPVTLVGTGETYSALRINVTLAGSNLTINNLNITETAYNAYAINFTSLGNTLTLVGSSTFHSASSITAGAAALVRVNNGTGLTITGAGSLSVNAHNNAAGIGSDSGAIRGDITIVNTTIYANTYGPGAAIGTGYNNSGSISATNKEIIIDNSTVVLGTDNEGIGGVYGGAGIGGGVLSYAGTITITNGSTISGTGAGMGALIGSGIWGGGATINITDSTVNATATGYGAVIGDGRGVASALVSAYPTVINITSSDVTAISTYTGATGSAAIGGSGYYNYYGVYGGNASFPTINITDSTVTATTALGNHAAAIGSGSNNGGSVVDTISAAINITDSTVTATGGSGTAIGGGRNYSAGNITISGDSTVTAISGDLAAGIGGGTSAGDLITGGTLTINDNPTVIAYSNAVDSAIYGVTVGGTGAHVVHGSLIADLVAPTPQTIWVRSYLNTSEEYVLTLPANYVSFATNTLGTAPSGQYISQISLDGINRLTLTRIDGLNREYIYELASDSIYRIIDLEVAYLVCINLNIAGEAGEVTCEFVESGTVLSSPPAPSRQGYSFVGWSTDPEGEYPVDFSTLPPEVLADITLYAQWTPSGDGGGTVPDVPTTGLFSITDTIIGEDSTIISLAVASIISLAVVRLSRRRKSA